MDHTVNEFLRKQKFEAYNKPGLQSGNRSLGEKDRQRRAVSIVSGNSLLVLP